MAATTGHAPLPQPAHFPMLLDVAVRYGDLGPDGLISTRAVSTWFEDARVGLGFPRFARALGGHRAAGYRILLASQEVERLTAIRWSGKLRVGIGVRRVGRTSFSYGYAVFVEEKCLAVGGSVTVLGGADGPAVLPDELRADLEDVRIGGAEAAEAPRPGPERRDPARYPFTLDVRARTGDIDTNRHANNVALVSWYADAVAALHIEALGSGWGGPPPELAPRSYRVQYVAEVGYPATYTLGLAVTAHDADAVRYELGLFHGERCVGLADASGARGELPVAALDAYRPVTP
jgi:acyl-CoA thioester hydrolase